MNLTLSNYSIQPEILRQLPGPVVIVGAAHSGKSELSHTALSPDLRTAVIGTGPIAEPELAARIAHLKAQRPPQWQVYEGAESLIAEVRRAVSAGHAQVLIDSLSQWIGAAIVGSTKRYSLEQVRTLVEHEIDELITYIQSAPPARIVIVTSEAGAGVTPAAVAPRLFRELLGKCNSRVAAACPTVVLVSCGLPLVLKTSQN